MLPPPSSLFVGSYDSQFDYSLAIEKLLVEPEALSYSTATEPWPVQCTFQFYFFEMRILFCEKVRPALPKVKGERFFTVFLFLAVFGFHIQAQRSTALTDVSAYFLHASRQIPS